eukprot:TCALIF_12389-PA protein Name:"Protein of unknown function" AED:0.43 eAED:0.43 QI:0/0.15/0/0.21/0.92/1/14/0/1492
MAWVLLYRQSSGIKDNVYGDILHTSSVPVQCLEGCRSDAGCPLLDTCYEKQCLPKVCPPQILAVPNSVLLKARSAKVGTLVKARCDQGFVIKEIGFNRPFNMKCEQHKDHRKSPAWFLRDEQFRNLKCVPKGTCSVNEDCPGDYQNLWRCVEGICIQDCADVPNGKIVQERHISSQTGEETCVADDGPSFSISNKAKLQCQEGYIVDNPISGGDNAKVVCHHDSQGSRWRYLDMLNQVAECIRGCQHDSDCPMAQVCSRQTSMCQPSTCQDLDPTQFHGKIVSSSAGPDFVCDPGFVYLNALDKAVNATKVVCGRGDNQSASDQVWLEFQGQRGLQPCQPGCIQGIESCEPYFENDPFKRISGCLDDLGCGFEEHCHPSLHTCRPSSCPCLTRDPNAIIMDCQTSRVEAFASVQIKCNPGYLFDLPLQPQKSLELVCNPITQKLSYESSVQGNLVEPPICESGCFLDSDCPKEGDICRKRVCKMRSCADGPLDPNAIYNHLPNRNQAVKFCLRDFKMFTGTILIGNIQLECKSEGNSLTWRTSNDQDDPPCLELCSNATKCSNPAHNCQGGACMRTKCNEEILNGQIEAKGSSGVLICRLYQLCNESCLQGEECDPKTCRCVPPVCFGPKKLIGGSIEGPDKIRLGMMVTLTCSRGFIFKRNNQASKSVRVQCGIFDGIPRYAILGTPVQGCEEGALLNPRDVGIGTTNLFRCIEGPQKTTKVFCSLDGSPNWKLLDGTPLKPCFPECSNNQPCPEDHLCDPETQRCMKSKGCPPNIPHGIIVPLRDGPKIISCKPGFKLVPDVEELALCSSDEVWTTPKGQALSCEPGCSFKYSCSEGQICINGKCSQKVLCPLGIPFSNGHLIPERKGQLGDVAIFECDLGYKQLGTETLELECSKQGWIPKGSVALIPQCQKGLDFPNSDLVVGETTEVGSSGMLVCKDDFVLDFSDDPILFQAIYCGFDQNTGDVNWLSQSTSDKVKDCVKGCKTHEDCSTHCAKGRCAVASDSQTLCSSFPNFDGTTECKADICTLECPMDKVIIDPNVRPPLLSSLTVQCEFVNGSGQWIFDKERVLSDPKCVPIRCTICDDNSCKESDLCGKSCSLDHVPTHLQVIQTNEDGSADFSCRSVNHRLVQYFWNKNGNAIDPEHVQKPANCAFDPVPCDLKDLMFIPNARIHFQNGTLSPKARRFTRQRAQVRCNSFHLLKVYGKVLLENSKMVQLSCQSVKGVPEWTLSDGTPFQGWILTLGDENRTGAMSVHCSKHKDSIPTWKSMEKPDQNFVCEPDLFVKNSDLKVPMKNVSLGTIFEIHCKEGFVIPKQEARKVKCILGTIGPIWTTEDNESVQDCVPAVEKDRPGLSLKSFQDATLKLKMKIVSLGKSAVDHGTITDVGQSVINESKPRASGQFGTLKCSIGFATGYDPTFSTSREVPLLPWTDESHVECQYLKGKYPLWSTYGGIPVNCFKVCQDHNDCSIHEMCSRSRSETNNDYDGVNE